MLAEIREQPDALRRLLKHESGFRRAASLIQERDRRLVRLVAHGSSDNAASYGVYALGMLAGWTAFRDSISLTVYSGATIDMTASTVIGLSQSGSTPDVIEYVRRARRGGALTIAVTNHEQSELAEVAELTLPLAAGLEQSIAATKTFTNEIAALALLAAYAGGRGPEYAGAIALVADTMETMLPEVEQHVVELALHFAFVGRMFIIGRGPEFATAREVSLKLLETCRVAAEPLTSTALAHGPVAALDALFPVWAIASPDGNLPALQEAVSRAARAGAAIVATGSMADEIDDAVYRIVTPSAPEPLLSPLLSIVPGQLFAWALARVKGLDPDRPTGLLKVTVAR